MFFLNHDIWYSFYTRSTWCLYSVYISFLCLISTVNSMVEFFFFTRNMLITPKLQEEAKICENNSFPAWSLETGSRNSNFYWYHYSLKSEYLQTIFFTYHVFYFLVFFKYFLYYWLWWTRANPERNIFSTECGTNIYFIISTLVHHQPRL